MDPAWIKDTAMQIIGLLDFRIGFGFGHVHRAGVRCASFVALTHCYSSPTVPVPISAFGGA
jgi:hypothetical protein